MSKILVKISCYILSVLIFLAGMLIFLYPMINRNLINNNAQQNIDSFRSIRTVYKEYKSDSNKDKSGNDTFIDYDKFDELYKDMKKYNHRIYEEGQKNLKDAWAYEQASFDLYSYGIYNGVIGEIRIPKMNCNLPLYMGATMGNMAKGAAQLGETSTPIGGKNTNCVIAGHRGASGGEFFLNIQNLKIGDKVYIDNLWESITYKVSKIEIINPDDIDRIFIQEGKDMVTLITCHPYPYNSQRYIVYCERTKNTDTNKVDTEIIEKTETYMKTQVEDNEYNSVTYMKVEKIIYVSVPIILVLLFVVLTFTGRKKKKQR